MKLNIKFKAIYFALIVVSFFSCQPRVELDNSVWGNTAEITAVVLFELVEATNQLGFEQEVTGYRENGVSADVAIDKDAAGESEIGQNPSVTITVGPSVDLTNIGIKFSHAAQKIVPLNSAPTAGVIGNFSSGPYVYRLISADGSERDWTVSFVLTTP